MDVHIEIQTSKGGTTLTVSGELKKQGLAELDRICREQPGALSLDLRNLRSADEEGVALLKSFVNRGARLTGVNPYLGLLLECDTIDQDESCCVTRHR